MHDAADIPTNMAAHFRDIACLSIANITLRPARHHMDHLVSSNRDLEIVLLRDVFRLLPRLPDIRFVVAAGQLIID